jgi:hypothetical protein
VNKTEGGMGRGMTIRQTNNVEKRVIGEKGRKTKNNDRDNGKEKRNDSACHS